MAPCSMANDDRQMEMKGDEGRKKTIPKSRHGENNRQYNGKADARDDGSI
jgi:hypothetical protein